MPIYEYRCSSCGHELEALQKLSEARLLACPSCGANSLVKQVSAAGFQLKGSGWYATDFKGGGKPAAAKPADPATASDAKPGGDKTEKTETKSEKTSDTAKPAGGAAPAAPATEV